MASNTAAGPSWDKNIDGLIKTIFDALADKPIARDLPGLKELLGDYLDPDVDVSRVDFHRRMLRVFRESSKDSTYQDQLDELSQRERERIERFTADGEPIDKCSLGFDMGASLGVREHIKAMLKGDPVHISSAGSVYVDGLSTGDHRKRDGVFHAFVHGLAKLFSCFRRKVPDEIPDRDEVIVYRNTPFQNWGLTVENLPLYTCIPTSTAAVQRIVKYAKAQDMGVRVAGFRHSWSPIFGRNGQILISLLSLHEATVIPNTTALDFLPLGEPTELETIEVVKGTPRTAGNTLVRVGTACTNERLRRWCIEGKRYTLPLNVIMVEMTIGGINGPVCHGSGRAHPTLSDLVRRVEYVDAHGALRVVDKAAHLRAAAGCFGLMGVITHLTLELAPMSYALMRPEKVPVVRAVPPPPDLPPSAIPPALRLELTAAQRAADQAAFEERANAFYYAEWFWFPFSDQCWVNCWQTTADPAGAVDYPDSTAVFFSFVSQFLVNVLQSAPLLRELIAELGLHEAAVTLLTRVAMFALPDAPVKVLLPDALHFQRGIQNVRVLDVEVEMPLQAARGAGADRIDYANVQRAWWDAILLVYKHASTCPQRFPLEMRIMGGSEVVLAPQRGNGLGTCSIEILTLQSAGDVWLPYAQEVLDAWMGYRDADGNRLRTRPHWAKQWKGLRVDGRPWEERLKEVDYKEAIAEWKGIMGDIGAEHGWTLADLKGRFSNEFFDWLIFDDVELPAVPNGVSNGNGKANAKAKAKADKLTTTTTMFAKGSGAT